MPVLGLAKKQHGWMPATTYMEDVARLNARLLQVASYIHMACMLKEGYCLNPSRQTWQLPSHPALASRGHIMCFSNEPFTSHRAVPATWHHDDTYVHQRASLHELLKYFWQAHKTWILCEEFDKNVVAIQILRASLDAEYGPTASQFHHSRACKKQTNAVPRRPA